MILNLYYIISENAAVETQDFFEKKSLLSCLCRIIKMMAPKCHLKKKKRLFLKYWVYIKCRWLEDVILTALMYKNIQFCTLETASRSALEDRCELSTSLPRDVFLKRAP